MTRILLSIFFLISITILNAQQPKKTGTPKKPASTSQPDMNKMLEEAMKDLPADQKAMMQEMMKKQQATTNNSGNGIIPKKRTDLLLKIPKISNDGQYKSFLDKLMQQALAKIDAKTISDVNKLVEKYKTNKTGLNNLPVTLFMQGQTNEAIYAAIACAQLNNNVLLSQNNLAFILHQTGYPHFALPLLEYYLASNPDAVMYNNAAQCYFTLGDTAKAMKYYMAAIRLNDNIAEAHCGTALLLISERKITEAIPHIEKAFRDGYSSILEDAVTNHKIKLNTDKMIKPVDEYFKPKDYAPLPPVRKIEDLIKKYEKVQMLQSSLLQWQQKSDATADSFKTGNQSWELSKVTGTFSRPVGRKAWFMSNLLSRDLANYTKDSLQALQQMAGKLAKEYNKMELGIEEEYKTGSFNSDYDECKMKERYLDAYLSATYISAQDAGNSMYKKLISFYNQQLHWQGFLFNNAEFKHLYFSAGASVLSTQIDLSSFQKMYPLPINIATSCNEVLQHPPNPDDIEGANKKCSYSIKIPAVVGSFKFTCDGWEIEGGEGIIVNIQVDERKGDFTIAFGPGVEENIGPTSAGVKAQFYFSGNKEGISDLGFRGEIKSELNMIVKQYEAGYAAQIGINSGVNAFIMDGSGNGPQPIFN